MAQPASVAIGAGPAPRAQVEATTCAKAMYLGGAVGVRGKSLDWINQLTVSPQAIEFPGKKVRFHIDPRSVRTLDYTGHKHVNDDAAGGGLLVGAWWACWRDPR
jgi:hypothetical protein